MDICRMFADICMYRKKNVTVASTGRRADICTRNGSLFIIPAFGTGNTNGWYALYRTLVRLLPQFGTARTTLWYSSYHASVRLLPPVGMLRTNRGILSVSLCIFFFSRRLIVIIRYLCVRIGCGSANREMPYQHQAVL